MSPNNESLNTDERRKMLEDEVRAFTDAIESGGMWIRGSRGQDILNPAYAARRAALEALRKLDLTAPASLESELEAFLNEGA